MCQMKGEGAYSRLGVQKRLLRTGNIQEIPH